MRGDVRIPFSVQHNVGSVENLDGVIFFRVSITASQTLQVLLIKARLFWGSKVITRGEEIIDGNKGAGLPQRFPLTNMLDVAFLDSLHYEQGRVVHM